MEFLKLIAAAKTIIEGADYSESDVDTIRSFIFQLVGESISTQQALLGQAGADLITGTLSLPEAREFVRKRKRVFAQLPDINRQDQVALVAGIGSLFAQKSHKFFFKDRNFAGVQVLKADLFGNLHIRRAAGEHRGWSLHLTTSGAGRYECIRQNFIARAGDLVLLNPDAPYNYVREDSENEWTHEWIHFQPEPRLLELINWPELGPSIYHCRVPPEELDRFSALFAEIRTIETHGENEQTALFINIIEQILLRSQAFLGTKQAVFRDTRVNDAKAFIMNNLRQTFAVQDISDHLGISRTQLTIPFKKATGQSILNWANERRMALAVQMLLHTDHSVGAIADELGYKDALYFSRKFRAHMGLSPRNYRKMHAAQLAS